MKCQELQALTYTYDSERRAKKLASRPVCDPEECPGVQNSYTPNTNRILGALGVCNRISMCGLPGEQEVTITPVLHVGDMDLEFGKRQIIAEVAMATETTLA